MKSLFLIGWVLLALEAVFAAGMILANDSPQDPAGRGVPRIFGFAMLPFLALAAALLHWASRSPSVVLPYAALLFAAAPCLIAGGLWASNTLDGLRDRSAANQSGLFADPHLTAIARAIDRKDHSALEALLKKNTPIDWQARDPWDATIVDHAIKRILNDYAGDVSVESVKLLLANGAPRPGARWVETVYGGNTPGTIPLLEALLKAGADPNARDQSGMPLIHFTHAWRSLDKVKLLAKYGADLKALNNRPDRLQWTPLMNAIYMQNWELASYFLAQGNPPDYRASDGKNVALLLEERAAADAANRESPADGYQRFLKELGKP